MLAAHALDALDAAEARSLEEHLATCAECRAELLHWRETASALAYAAGNVEPAPAVRTRILAAAHAAAATSSAVTGSDDDSRNSANATKNVLPFAQPAPSRWSAPQKFGAIAAGLIIAALLIAFVVSRQRNQALQSELAQLIEHNRQLEAEVARLSSREGELQTQIAGLSDRGQKLQTEAERAAQLAREAERNNGTQIGTPPTPTPSREVLPTDNALDQHVIAMSGTPVAPAARAQLVFNSRTGRATLTADHLPPMPSGKTYQLWLIVDGRPVSGGIFNADRSGRAVMRGQMPLTALKASVFAVTLEPAGGTSAPTGDKYLLGQAS